MISLYTQVEDSGHRIPQDPAGKHRNSPEIVRIFPVNSCQLPVRSNGNRPEIIGKSPKNFRPESCFHVPGNFGVFRPEPAGTY
jgi:hypothetical protein